MRPSKDVNKIIGGVLARYAEIFGIEILAFNFLSNHKHVLYRAPLGDADEFEENVNREIARRINWKLQRCGKFWSRRYDDEPVLSDEDLLEAFLYVTTNATRHGLVEHPSLWPGLSSYQQSITEEVQIFPFHHYSAAEEEDRITYHILELTPLPQFADMPPAERKARVKALIDERAQSICESRRAVGLGFLGAEAVKLQDPFDTPSSVSRSPRPYCYTKDADLRRQFKESARLRRALYIEASMRYRLGDKEAKFPSFTFKPPLHRKPRSTRFKPLPEDYFKKAA